MGHYDSDYTNVKCRSSNHASTVVCIKSLWVIYVFPKWPIIYFIEASKASWNAVPLQSNLAFGLHVLNVISWFVCPCDKSSTRRFQEYSNRTLESVRNLSSLIFLLYSYNPRACTPWSGHHSPSTSQVTISLNHCNEFRGSFLSSSFTSRQNLNFTPKTLIQTLWFTVSCEIKFWKRFSQSRNHPLSFFIYRWSLALGSCDYIFW